MPVSLTLIVTLVTLGLHCTKVSGGRNCSNLLTVTMNNQIINSSDVCVAEFGKKECWPFVESFNRSDLPDVFSLVSPTVERPSGIDLVTLVTDRINQDNHELYKYPGVRVEWRSPISENARHYLEGFLLILQRDTYTLCRLFQMNTSSRFPDMVKMLTFSYDINNLTPASDYSVKVYSIPPPHPEYKNEPERFVWMNMTSFREFSYQNDPALWTPSISIKTWPAGSIDVKFTRSPPEFNFTNFEIQLWNKSSVLCKNVTRTEEIRPLDPFKLLEGKCYCWKRVPNSVCQNERCCENNCQSIQTQWFDLTVTETLTSTETSVGVTVVKDHTTLPHPSQLSSTRLSNDEVIGIVFGALAAAFIVTAVLVVWLKRKHYLIPNSLYLRWPCSSDETPALNKVSDFSDKHVTELPARSSAPLTTKKLYIMSADDHCHSVRMVEALANYLEVHCRCQVIYPPTAEDMAKFDSPYSWFISHITSSDHIVCVLSRGAEKLSEAHLGQMVYRDRELRPEGDLFTECLKHIYKDQKARDKVINIFFGITEPEAKFITSPFTFGIPRKIPELVLKIHSINSRRRDAHSGELPLLRESLTRLPMGMELVSAVDQSERYERDNPDWLCRCFGEATHLTSTRMSPALGEISLTPLGDSGIYDMGPRSASTVFASANDEDDACGMDGQTRAFDGASSVSAGAEQRDVTSNAYPSSIIPPDALSEGVGSIGTAFACINESNGADGGSGVSDEGWLVHIIPPDSMSDVNNVSEVFKDINRFSDSAQQRVNAQCEYRAQRHQQI